MNDDSLLFTADSLLKQQTAANLESDTGGGQGRPVGPRPGTRKRAPVPLALLNVLPPISHHRSKRDLERSLARDLTRMRAFYKISLLASAEGKPEEIGNTVLWLCSEGAGFVVGHALVADGGQTVV